MRHRLALSAAIILGVGTIAALSASGVVRSPQPAGASAGASSTPIKHVVVFMQENHSFNNILGALCVQQKRCTGTTTGTLSTGQSISLSAAPDVVPGVDHSIKAQTTAIDGGKMDGFDKVNGCSGPKYACYSVYEPTLSGGKPNPSVQNVISLAKTFAVSDMTFEPGPVPSWGEHLALATANDLDGFSGDNPTGPGPGWGCDSGDTAPWSSTGLAPFMMEPSCVPAPKGSPEVKKEPTAVRNSPAHWVPTIMDSLKKAGDTFKIYGASKSDGDYIWDTCPTFADCLYTNEAKSMVPDGQRRYRRQERDAAELLAAHARHRSERLDVPAQRDLDGHRGQLDRQGRLGHREWSPVAVDRHLPHVGRLRVLLRRGRAAHRSRHPCADDPDLTVGDQGVTPTTTWPPGPASSHSPSTCWASRHSMRRTRTPTTTSSRSTSPRRRARSPATRRRSLNISSHGRPPPGSQPTRQTSVIRPKERRRAGRV